MAKRAAPSESAPTTVADTIQRIRVTLRGLPPGLLMDSKAGMEEDNAKKTKPKSPEEEARLAAYWTEVDGRKQLALPWESVYKSLISAGKRFKFKGRESMTNIIAATVTCEQTMISLGISEYVHHKQWGRIPPKTGGVVMLNRAHVPEWEATFTMIVDAEFYQADMLREVLATAGKQVGVLRARPELKGAYGRFIVTGWEVLS